MPSPEGELPLVTATRDGSRRVVAAVNVAASRIGLRPGIPVAQAQAAVPGLVVREAEPEADAAALSALAAWCLRYAPVVQPDGPDGVFLDVAGAAHLQGGEAALLDDLVRRLRRAGFTASAALADTPGAAAALARHRPGTVAPPGGARAALAPLPVSSLRLESEAVRTLALLGVETVGALSGLPRPSLARRFDPGLLDVLDKAEGRVPHPLAPLVPETLPGAGRAFAEPLGDAAGLAEALRRLLPVLCRDLEAREAGLRRLDAVFRRLDGQPAAIRIGTAAPSRDPAHLLRLLAERLPAIDPGFGIDAVRLLAGRLEPLRGRQADAGPALDPEGAAAGPAALAPLVDRLGTRLGAARVFRAAPVQSRVPERSVRRVPALAPFSGDTWPPGLPRPSRMMEPPEPVTAVAIVPDDPPTFFIWRRVRYVVRSADGPERVRGEWWRDDREVGSVRDYYRVEDAAGRRFWLFRDAPMAEGGRWWVHGRFA